MVVFPGGGMKRIGWFCLLFFPSVFIMAIIFYPWKFPLEGTALGSIAMFVGSCVFVSQFGNFWMAYQAIRYEERPLPYILLFLVPFSFIYYYFERVKCKKQARRFLEPNNSARR